MSAGSLPDPPAGLTFRTATAADLPSLVRMLAEDGLGRERERLEDPLPPAYSAAYAAIERDPNNEIVVACRGPELIASLQLTYTPSLSYEGSWRATVESVRTAAPWRGRGVGTALVRWAIERAAARGCRLIQLSTHKSRTDAQRFYQRLGFRATHEGMKLDLGAR